MLLQRAGPWVESPILFAEIDALCEGPRVAAVRNACLYQTFCQGRSQD